MIRLKVRKTIENNHLIRNGDKVLIAVSGGPDSMALLHIMAELRHRYDIEIFIAHFNHMLRGKAADKDAEFVEKTADSLSVKCVTGKSDIRKISRSQGLSIEEAAREARYDFYKWAAKKTGAVKVATGHTLDDQAETVLMRLIKGSGSRGLSGIPYRRELGGISVIRPLLDVPRKEVEQYLKKNKIPSRIDASNFLNIYFRNKVRNILIPLLEKKFNPGIKNVLASTASTLGGESAYLAGLALKKMKRVSRQTDAGVELRIKDLMKEDIALRRLIIRQAIDRVKGDLRGIAYGHWQTIEAIASGGELKSVNLPGHIKAMKKGGSIIFASLGSKQLKKSAAEDRRYPARQVISRPVVLSVPGAVNIPALNVTVKAEIVKSCPDFTEKKNQDTEYVNGDLIRGRLTVRTRQKGDRIKPLGMGSYKKIHDLFIDEKISREKRDLIPVVVRGRALLWVAGVKLSDEFKIMENTKRIIKLSLARGNTLCYNKTLNYHT